MLLPMRQRAQAAGSATLGLTGYPADGPGQATALNHRPWKEVLLPLKRCLVTVFVVALLGFVGHVDRLQTQCFWFLLELVDCVQVYVYDPMLNIALNIGSSILIR